MFSSMIRLVCKSLVLSAVICSLWILRATPATAANVSETMNIQANITIDGANAGNEVTQRVAAPPNGSGLRWGAYNAGTGDVCELRGGDAAAPYAGGTIRFKATANTHGSYIYTIFDSTGAQPPVSPTVVNNPYRITFQAGDLEAGETVRLMVRRANGAAAYPGQQWYISEPIAAGDTAVHAILVASVQWAAVNTASNAILNPVANGDEAAISFGSLGTWAATGVTSIDGGGFYVESGNLGHWRLAGSILWEEAPPAMPIIAPIANQSAAVNHQYSFTPSLSFDAGQAGETWTLVAPSPLKGNMAFTASNGRITWTPQAADLGTTVGFTLGVSNVHGAAVNNVSWVVTIYADQVPVINPSADSFVVGGNATAPNARARYRKAMSAATAVNRAPVTTWTLAVTPQLIGNIAINSSSGVIDGRPALADVGTLYTFNVIAKNAAGSSLVNSWKVKVVSGVAEPFLQIANNATITLGGTETITVPNGTGGPGFGWGGYIDNYAMLPGKVIQFDKEDTGDLEFAREINVAGDYVYTIFDNLSNNTTPGTYSASDTAVNAIHLGGAVVISLRTTDIGGQNVSLLLRDKVGHWFRSTSVFLPNANDSYLDVIVTNFAASAWTRVGTAAETNMNLLNNGGSVALGTGSGTPDFSVVTGGGLAIDNTNLSAINDLEINQISWADGGAIVVPTAVESRNWSLYQ